MDKEISGSENCDSGNLINNYDLWNVNASMIKEADNVLLADNTLYHFSRATEQIMMDDISQKLFSNRIFKVLACLY